jgi:hypothetical protein
MHIILDTAMIWSGQWLGEYKLLFGGWIEKIGCPTVGLIDSALDVSSALQIPLDSDYETVVIQGILWWDTFGPSLITPAAYLLGNVSNLFNPQLGSTLPII